MIDCCVEASLGWVEGGSVQEGLGVWDNHMFVLSAPRLSLPSGSAIHWRPSMVNPRQRVKSSCPRKSMRRWRNTRIWSIWYRPPLALIRADLVKEREVDRDLKTEDVTSQEKEGDQSESECSDVTHLTCLSRVDVTDWCHACVVESVGDRRHLERAVTDLQGWFSFRFVSDIMLSVPLRRWVPMNCDWVQA